MKNEKVTIEIKESRTPCVKHELCEMPVNDMFDCVPKYCPELRQYVRSVKWNTVKKVLNIELVENSNCQAYKWFSTINDRKTQAQKGLVDLDQDVILLAFLSETGRVISRFKFSKLELLNHSCHVASRQLCSAFGIDAASEALVHKIKVRYIDVTDVPVNRQEEEGLAFVDPNELVDEEWHTAKAP